MNLLLYLPNTITMVFILKSRFKTINPEKKMEGLKKSANFIIKKKFLLYYSCHVVMDKICFSKHTHTKKSNLFFVQCNLFVTDINIVITY